MLRPIDIEKLSQEDEVEPEVNANTEDEPDKRNIILAEYGDTLCIKIKSFSSKHLEEDKEIFERIEKYLSKKATKNIIFDIRGNTGGTDEYFRNFSIFTSNDVVFSDRFRNLLSNENQEITHTVIPASVSAQDYNRYLLVDRKVFSTAETLSMICKSSGFAKVVGEITGGEGFGLTPYSLNIVDKNTKFIKKENNKTYSLSGIKMSFPVEAPINEDGEIDYEGFYKTIPDIICNSEKGEDALEVALKDIESKEKNKRIEEKDFERE